MKKLNVQEICAAYNTARKQLIGTSFTFEQLHRELVSYGLSKNIAKRLINEKFFIVTQISGLGRGRHFRYEFFNAPIHISVFQNYFYGEQTKKDVPFEEECIAYLKSLGYKIYKPEGFDLKAFKSENPEIFEKYSICKEV